MTSSARAALAVAAITLLALAVRLVGIGHLLPHVTEPDLDLVTQTNHFRYDLPDEGVRSSMSKYPHLLARLLAVVTPAPIADPAEPAAPDVDPLAHHLEAASRQVRDGRIVMAILGSLVVLGTYLLARGFLGTGPSLLASALVATSLLHLVYAQQLRPHAALTTATTFALVGCLRAQRLGTLASLAWAGLLGGLAVGCLHNGLAIVPAGVAAVALRRRPAGHPRARRIRDELLAWLLPLALIALAIVVFYPFLLASEGGAAEVGDTRVDQGGHRVFMRWLNGQGFEQIAIAFRSHDPVLAILALLGSLIGLVALARGEARGRWGPLLVVLAFAVPQLLLFGMLHSTVARYLLPLLPTMALAAAFGCARTCRLITRSLPDGARRIVTATLVALVLALPAWSSARLSWQRARPDTLMLAADWIAENLDRGRDRIAVEASLALPLFHTQRSLQWYRHYLPWWRPPWRQYQELLDQELADARGWSIYPLARRTESPRSAAVDAILPRTPDELLAVLEDTGCRWVVVLGQGSEVDPSQAALRSRGELVARFAPSAEADLGQAKGFQLKQRMLRRALVGTRWGPEVEIYRVTP